MTINEVTKTRDTIEDTIRTLTSGLEVAQERARTYYDTRVAPAEKDTAVSDEEMDAIYDTYDELADTCESLANKLEIAENALVALVGVESILGLAAAEGVWEEG